jgi:hypothetical protein
MTFITAGLTNGGRTNQYTFSYDESLENPRGPEPSRTNAVIAACEYDYNLMSQWFGRSDVTGMDVQVTTQSNGASWNGYKNTSTVSLNAQGFRYSNNPAYLRYLIISEVTEIFMMTQNIGWFQGQNEGSKGEGLSRFLGGQFLAHNGFLNIGVLDNFSVSDLWLNSPRQDFVNFSPDDNQYDAVVVLHCSSTIYFIRLDLISTRLWVRDLQLWRECGENSSILQVIRAILFHISRNC